MSERKVLNKYYPPEFDPSKIPKLKQSKNRTFSIRIMAPFNMRCNTCGEYIYKGKKFNSRKENVDDEDYLGLRIFRFYIKCPRCVAEIAFKTDLANTDYALEAGATRLFEAEKLAHQMAEKERKEKEEDELNPMKVLENRTKASRNEMEQLDQLEELREINARHARMDQKTMLAQHMAYEEQLLKLQEEEEDQLVKAILRKGAPGQMIRRIQSEDTSSSAKKAKLESVELANPTDVLTCSTTEEVKTSETKPKSSGIFSSKSSLTGLVKRKTPSKHTLSSTESSLSVNGVQKETSTLPSTSTPTPSVATSPAVSGLVLLGGYSDSEEGDSSD